MKCKGDLNGNCPEKDSPTAHRPVQKERITGFVNASRSR